MFFLRYRPQTRRILTSALLIAGVGFLYFPLSADDDRALVRSLIGNADVIRGGNKEALQVGSIIKDSDQIQTGHQSQIVLRYKGIEIRLRGDTDATLLSLTNMNQAASIQMNKGFAWFKVEDPTKRGFKVQTPTSVAAVRGTKFAVGFDEKGSTSCVCQGTVATSSAAPGSSEALVKAGGSHDYSANGQFSNHDFTKYFKKLKVDRSFQQEILRDSKLSNCKSCHRMTNLATDSDPETSDY